MHIAIIGNGISGITAARFIRKLSDFKITVISAESEHFFSRTALMYVYMGHMKWENIKPYEDWFWEKNRIELKQAFVKGVDFEGKTLQFKKGDSLKYDKLIIACGSTPNKFGWPGQDLDGVQGLYSKQDLEGMERYSDGLQRAVIVGGGLIGIEMAEMFHSRHIPVTFLVRENSYWNGVLPKEESEMINQEIVDNGIDLRLSTELKEILSDENGRVKAVVTDKGETIDCQFVGLTAGVRPNINFLKDQGLEMQKGILVDEFLATNQADVYAIGDCAQLREPQEGRRPIEAVWYTGRMMGETVAHSICQQKTAYRPRHWFNSAKFFDIEYQVYGAVSGRPPDHHDALYWEREDGKAAIRLVYDKNEGHIVGFNLMGVRYRHEVCEKWLLAKTPLKEVVQNLRLANFDPEFYRKYAGEIVDLYNQKFDENLSLKKKGTLNAVLQFLGRG